MENATRSRTQEERVRELVARGRSQAAKGHWEEARSTLLAALGKGGNVNPELRNSALHGLTVVYRHLQEHAESREKRGRLLANRPMEDRLQVATALLGLGTTYLQQGREDLAMDRLTRARHIFLREREWGYAADCLTCTGIALCRLQQWEDALAALTRAVEELRRLKSSSGLARAYTELAVALYACDRLRQAANCRRHAASLASALGDRAALARVQLLTARTHLARGWLGKARILAAEALAELERFGDAGDVRQARQLLEATDRGRK